MYVYVRGGGQLNEKENEEIKMHAHHRLFKKSPSQHENKANLPVSHCHLPLFLYLLSPVDPRQNLAADVAVLSWL